MSLSALRSVGDAIDATRAFMLPVSVRRWASLAVVVLFMGTPGTPVPANPQFFDPTLWQWPERALEGVEDPVAPPERLTVELLDPGTWPPWLVAGVLALVGAWVAYQVVGVLMRFVLVAALARGEVRFLADAREHAVAAGRVLVFRFVVGALATLVAVPALVVASPVGPWNVGGGTAGALGALAGVVGVLAWLVDAATLQFVVPTMFRIDGGVVAAWRRFWRVLTDELVEYGAYVVVRAALGVGVGIAAALAVGVALALGGLVVLTLGAVVVLLDGGLGAIGGLATVTLVVLVLGFLAYALAAYGAATAPFQVYLWTYALFVLGDTDERLDLIPQYREAARADDGPLAGSTGRQ